MHIYFGKRTVFQVFFLEVFSTLRLPPYNSTLANAISIF